MVYVYDPHSFQVIKSTPRWIVRLHHRHTKFTAIIVPITNTDETIL
jgi:hypothetical protein